MQPPQELRDWAAARDAVAAGLCLLVHWRSVVAGQPQGEVL